MSPIFLKIQSTLRKHWQTFWRQFYRHHCFYVTGNDVIFSNMRDRQGRQTKTKPNRGKCNIFLFRCQTTSHPIFHEQKKLLRHAISTWESSNRWSLATFHRRFLTSVSDLQIPTVGRGFRPGFALRWSSSVSSRLSASPYCFDAFEAEQCRSFVSHSLQSSQSSFLLEASAVKTYNHNEWPLDFAPKITRKAFLPKF